MLRPLIPTLTRTDVDRVSSLPHSRWGCWNDRRHRRRLQRIRGNGLPKSPAIAFVDSPTAEIRYPIPVEWHGKTIWAQVRTHAQDYENETLYRPRQITLDGSGDDDTPVYGTATILAAEKHNDGGLRVRFSFTASRTGATPTAFTLTKATGTRTIAPGSVDYVADGRTYEVDVAGLTDAEAYTFTLSATHAGGSTDLATVAFTGDSSGPPAVIAAAVEI